MSDSTKEVKVVLLGESGVGKTSILFQFCNGKFNQNCESSISAQYFSKTINLPCINKSIKFCLWDTSGVEQYRSLAKIFYKDATIIILIYDITSKKSFNEMKDFWYNSVKSNQSKDGQIISIVANKSDLNANIKVENSEGEEFANSIGALFQAISAKSTSGVASLFENIGQRYFEFENILKILYD